MPGALLLHGLVPADTSHMADAPEHSLVACDESAALVSAAPPDIEDLGVNSISDLALRHHAILAAYCAGCAVIPTRFGSVFSSVEALKLHLTQTTDWTRRALQTLANLREYTVRITVTGDPALPTGAVVSGRDFLARGRDLRNLRISLIDRRKALARQLLAKVDTLVEHIEATAVPKPERILDVAFLIPRDRVVRLNALFNEFGAEAEALGLKLLITGPWPAYSFKADTLEDCHGT